MLPQACQASTQTSLDMMRAVASVDVQKVLCSEVVELLVKGHEGFLVQLLRRVRPQRLLPGCDGSCTGQRGACFSEKGSEQGDDLACAR